MVVGLTIIATLQTVLGALLLDYLGYSHSWITGIALGMLAPVVLVGLRILPLLANREAVALTDQT